MVKQLDVSDFDSVRKFAAEINEEEPHIHVLVFIFRRYINKIHDWLLIFLLSLFNFIFSYRVIYDRISKKKIYQYISIYKYIYIKLIII